MLVVYLEIKNQNEKRGTKRCLIPREVVVINALAPHLGLSESTCGTSEGTSEGNPRNPTTKGHLLPL